MCDVHWSAFYVIDSTGRILMHSGLIKFFKSVQIKLDQTVQEEEENLDSAEVGSEGSLDSAGS